jgi:hypothetical protein
MRIKVADHIQSCPGYYNIDNIYMQYKTEANIDDELEEERYYSFNRSRSRSRIRNNQIDDEIPEWIDNSPSYMGRTTEQTNSDSDYDSYSYSDNESLTESVFMSECDRNNYCFRCSAVMTGSHSELCSCIENNMIPMNHICGECDSLYNDYEPCNCSMDEMFHNMMEEDMVNIKNNSAIIIQKMWRKYKSSM